MRTAWFVAARVVAIVLLLCTAVAGHGFDMERSAGTAILGLLCATGGCSYFVANERARWRADHTGVRRRLPSFRALGSATVVCVPVALGLGLWDALQSGMQTGCLRETFAPLFLPLIWICHQEAIWRYTADMQRMDA